MKTLTPAEALIALAEGKKVISDTTKSFICLDGVRLLYQNGGTCNSISHTLEGSNLRIYEEPKKKVKVALYAYKYTGNSRRWEIAMTYYKDDNDFFQVFRANTLVAYKRLDGTNGTKDTTLEVDV